VSRFLFLALPMAGHVYPLAAVAAALTRRGHAVAWAGSETFLRPLLGVGPTVYPIRLRLHRGLTDLGLASTRSRWEGYVVPHTRSALPGVAAAVESFRPDVLAVDQHAVAGALAAHRYGLPWATLATGSMELTRPYLAVFPKVEEWIRGHLAGLWSAAGLPGEPPHDLRFSPHLTLAFTTPALAGTDGLPHEHVNPLLDVGAVEFVGPALGERAGTVDFPWQRLDPARPRVLVTVGTLSGDFASDFHGRMLSALRPLAGRLQAIVVAPGGPGGPGESVAEHVLVVPRVPILDLLPHLSAVVCHGGMNTVSETLAHGVPLVIAPMKSDQPINATRVAAAGAGIRVNFFRARPEALRAAVCAVLDDPAYRAAAGRIRDSFAAAGGAAAAAGHLERLAGTAPERVHAATAGTFASREGLA
jgi:UDP:flavonoid glycosyltransferase YjiC (YdhE family)